MKKITDFVRRVAGMLLLVFLALLFYAAFRLTLPASSTGRDSSPQGGSSLNAYPPPGATPTPTRTPTRTPTNQPYPPPGGKSLPEPNFTPMPTPVPTATPWTVPALPAFRADTPPGPFGEMRIVYADHRRRGFFAVDLSGKELFQWPVWPEEQRSGILTDMLHVSPDGSQVLYGVWIEGPGSSLSNIKHRSIWTMDPDGSHKRRLVAAADDWYPVDPIWSPDGKQIAYRAASKDPVSLMPASRELWVMNADGSEQRQLLKDDTLLELELEAPALFFRWMANGYIYFANESLYAVNPEDGSLYRLMDSVDALDLRFQVSPDGKHAYGSTDLPIDRSLAAGFQAVYLPDSYYVIWSQDGSRLAYVTAGGGGTWMRDLASGKERQLLPYQMGEDVRLRGFSPDNRYLAYQVDAGLYVIDLESEPIEAELVVPDPHVPETGDRALDFLAWIPVR